MADDFVKNILKEWELDQLTEIFENESIDEEAFRLLERNVIKDIIKKVGLRMKFEKKYTEWFSLTEWTVKVSFIQKYRVPRASSIKSSVNFNDSNDLFPHLYYLIATIYLNFNQWLQS